MSGQIRKFIKEFSLLSSLNHENIVRYIGLSELYPGELPLMVMELMSTNLHDRILCTKSTPLTFQQKISVLQNILSGLNYLHRKQVIHRDLTAKNVLLDASLIGKISDFGNSRILSTEQLSYMTTNPGTLVYLAPEATSHGESYNEAVDIFAFGHLSLFIFIEEFPSRLLSVKYKMHGKQCVRTEVERRDTYMKKLQLCIKPNEVIKLLISMCLEDEPSDRPLIKDLSASLSKALNVPPETK